MCTVAVIAVLNMFSNVLCVVKSTPAKQFKRGLASLVGCIVGLNLDHDHSWTPEKVVAAGRVQMMLSQYPEHAVRHNEMCMLFKCKVARVGRFASRIMLVHN